MNWNILAPIGLLAGSNVVMNLAWYGHLKFPHKALWVAVLAAWGLAFFEYCLAVPANRIGAQAYSLAELKTMTEGREAPPLSTTPEAVAEAVASGLAAGRHTVWVPGVMRWVMSGVRHTPRAIFRKLPF